MSPRVTMFLLPIYERRFVKGTRRFGDTSIRQCETQRESFDTLFRENGGEIPAIRAYTGSVTEQPEEQV